VDGGKRWGLQKNHTGVDAEYCEFVFYNKDMGVLVDEYVPTTIYFTDNGGGPITYNSVENLKENRLSAKLWPVPAHEMLNVTLPDNFKGKIFIYDLQGREMQSSEVENSPLFHLKVSDYHSGMYLLRMQSNTGSSLIKKFEVTR
jgi:hypothetical protein